MESTRTPDKWMLLQITGTHPHYRLFASWHKDSQWRMNTGVVGVSAVEGGWLVESYEGVNYLCKTDGYGATEFGWDVARAFEEHSGGRMEIITQCPADLASTDWQITRPIL